MLPGLLGLSLACATGTGPVAPEELKNLSYHGIYDRAVTLDGGVYDGELFVPGGPSRPRLELASSSKSLGPLSPPELEGVTWKLTRLARNEEVPDGVRITARFKNGKVSGNAGCNRYFAPVTGKEPGQLDIGLVGSTKMACPPAIMQIEDRYLRALQQVQRFSFVSGQLALTYEDGGEPDTLLFSPS